MREIKFRAWEKNLKEMIPVHSISFEKKMINTENAWRLFSEVELIQNTGLKDKNGKEIYAGDIVSLRIDDRETRHFEVAIETVVREVVSHPSFIDKTAKVEITAVVFKWNGYELFPCIDEKGQSDTSRMAVIGNIYENPNLLE